MATNISTAFLTLFDAEVHQAFQGESVLAGTVRTRTEVGSSVVKFPKLASAQASERTPGAEVTAVNATWSQASVTLKDWSASEYSDIFNQAKVNYDERSELAEMLGAPVCTGYQHNDAFPGSHPLHCGPLGYNGSKAAMQIIKKADIVLALGTRLNPFSTLPGYGIDYWPKQAKIIQVDINSDRIGLTKKVSLGIVGDAKKVINGLISHLNISTDDNLKKERSNFISQTKSSWAQELSSLDHEEDDPGTTWNERARKREPEKMSPRMAWRSIQSALPKDAIISSDIGNNCAIGNAYPTFEEGRKYLAPGLFGPCGYGLPAIIGAKIGQPSVPVVGFAGDGAFGISVNEMTSIGRKEWPAITMVIFRNYQWGAEKRNTTLWFKDNFVGTELDLNVSYAKMAEACGFTGKASKSMDELRDQLTDAIRDQMENSKTTFLEVMLNQELGEPFRRDAMKAPVEVSGISENDMESSVSSS